jgi:hypothetical protein
LQAKTVSFVFKEYPMSQNIWRRHHLRATFLLNPVSKMDMVTRNPSYPLNLNGLQLETTAKNSVFQVDMFPILGIISNCSPKPR